MAPVSFEIRIEGRIIALKTDTGTKRIASRNQSGSLSGINEDNARNRVAKVRQPVQIMAIQTLIVVPVFGYFQVS